MMTVINFSYLILYLKTILSQTKGPHILGYVAKTNFPLPMIYSQTGNSSIRLVTSLRSSSIDEH